LERVVIIGNSGGGKSVLPRKLARRRDLPYHEIDAASGVALTPVSTMTRRKP
jgi:adenylate kinase family enzyme